MFGNSDNLISDLGEASPAGIPVVLITGASKGIGRAFAQEFASRGHNLFLVARRPESLEETARDLRAAFPISVMTYAVDLLESHSIQQLKNAVDASDCFVEILVNNVGIVASGGFVHTSTQKISDIIKINVSTPTKLIRLFLPEMLKQKSGGVINVASTAGLAPVPYLATYSASKSFVVSLTRALHREVKDCGVHIMAVTPGPVATSFMREDRARTTLTTRLYPRLVPSTVARVAVDGFQNRRVVVTPGLLNALVSMGAKFVPQGLITTCLALTFRRSGQPDKGLSK